MEEYRDREAHRVVGGHTAQEWAAFSIAELEAIYDACYIRGGKPDRERFRRGTRARAELFSRVGYPESAMGVKKKPAA